MDVEKTMEFILRQQANAEVQMAAMREQQLKAERRQDKAEREMAAIRQQQAKAEGQMAAIRKLIQTGMRMIVRIEELAKRNEEHIKKNEELIKEVAWAQKDLAKAQKVTETKLQGLIDALRRGGNGNHRKN